jgi:uncharacterized membrane protein YfcA
VTPLDVAALSLIFFVTSVISVVTGATSLITVPALLAFGMPAATAIGTNMLALTAMSVGATMTFLRDGVIERERMYPLLGLTLVGSVIGALLVFAVPENLLPPIIAGAMLAVTVVVLRPPFKAPHTSGVKPRGPAVALGYGLTLLLGIYGGFFSGGYVTLLTVVFVVCFQMTFKRAVATTKVMNVASSLIATLIFAWRGILNWPLGILLSLVMYLGANQGAQVTLRLNEIWLRRLFVAVVLGLALKILALDVRWERLW